MVENVAVTKLIFDIFDLEKKKISTEDFVTKFGEELKLIFGLDEVVTKLVDKGATLKSAEEFAMSTAKPYIDNRLSEYSDFDELVNYHNVGYKSCAILPISIEGKKFATITLLSKNEDRFDSNVTNAISISTVILGYQLLSRMEYEKSLSLAKYFDAAFNNLIPQILIDGKGTVIKANKSMLNLFSSSTKELAGRNVNELFNIDMNMLLSLSKGLAAEAKIVGVEDRRFRVTSNKVNENILHASFYETSDLKHLEERAKLLKYSNSEGFIMMDRESKIIWASDNIEKILRCQKEALLDRKLLDIVAEKEKLKKAVENLGNDVYTDSIEVNVGNGMFVNVKASLFKNDLYGMSCILLNNVLERYFKSIESNFEELVKMSGDAIIFIDQLGYIKRMNRSAEEIFGYKEAELVGTPASLMYSEKDAGERFIKALTVAKNEGIINNIYAVVKKKKEDETVPCDQSIRSIFDENGELSGYIIVSRELATKRTMEQLHRDIEAYQRDIETVKRESDLKTQFIYNISHDLKTPITNIKGFSKLIYNENFGSLNEDQRGYMKTILDESDRLTELIQQMLDVAKLSSGKVKLEQQQIDMKKLGENPSIKSLEEVARGKSLEFSWNVDYNVPEVFADPNRIIQVFVNLLSNAIKFTEHGGIRVNITRKGKSVMSEVIDTGIGISKEDQKKLFRKFYQVQKKGLTKQEGSGTGLGLSIAKGIVNLHQGRMGFKSEPGKGSTFWFTIPISGKKKRQKEQEQSKVEKT